MRRIAGLFLCIIIAISSYAQPQIDSLSATSGNPGSSLVIYGKRFTTTVGSPIVFFGSVIATVQSFSDTTIAVVVPVGAIYSTVSVTVNNLTSVSPNAFIPTFPGTQGEFIENSFNAKLDLPIGMYPHSVQVADFNNDGKNDVMVCRGSSDKISILQNNSSGQLLSFLPQVDFQATGFNHEGSAIGDIDGDGKLDVLITNSHSLSSVSIFRNQSSGSNINFAPKVDLAADNIPYSLAVGDLTGDGKPDLAIANTGSNLISIYKNTSTVGNISFDTRVDIVVGSSPFGIAIGDLDGDNKAEIAVSTQGSSSAFYILRNTGSGGSVSFDNPLFFGSIQGAYLVAIGDLNNDNKPDVAVGAGNSILVFQNSGTPGNIAFYSQVYVAAGNGVEGISITDLNGDGKPDLVSSNRNGNSVSVVRNVSTNFMEFAFATDYSTGEAPIYVAVADLDGDARPEILTANSSSTAISVLRNLMDKNVSPLIYSFSPSSGSYSTKVVIKGLNFSGATAVQFGGENASSFTVDSSTGITAIVNGGNTGEVSVVTNNGIARLSGFTFTGASISTFSPKVGDLGTEVSITGTNLSNVTAVKFGSIAAASFIINSSTSITAIVGIGASGAVTIVAPNGTDSLEGFSYGPPAKISLQPVSGPVGSTVTITGTGFQPTPAGNIVYFGAVKATVTAANSNSLKVLVPAGATYQPVTVTTNNRTAYSSLPFLVTFPNDNPTLTAAAFGKVLNFGTGNYPVSLAVGDFNVDGKPDIVTNNSIGNNISILTNSSTNGSISISAILNLSTDADPRRVAIGDLDGDGLQDIVVTSFNAGNPSTISVFRNTTSGSTISFAEPAKYVTGNGSSGVAIADMTMDGKPDIIVSSGNSGFISVFENGSTGSGNITLMPKVDFRALYHADNICVADLNDDGKPELIASNFSGNSITIFLNASSGGFLSLAPVHEFATGINPYYVTTGDVDGDGKLDIIGSNYSSKSISVYLNTSSSGSFSFIPTDKLIEATNVALGDLNGDGKPDLAAGIVATGNIAAIENSSIPGNVVLGDTLNFSTGNFDTFSAIADMNGDGRPELIGLNTLLNTVSVFTNKINPPAITKVSDSTSGTGAVITLSGTNFTGVTAVSFGGVPAVSYNVISPKEIVATVGGGASGDIVVTTKDGIAKIGGFKFIPAVSANGPLTFCNSSVVLSSTANNNNQWYKDGAAINSATNKTITVNSSGNYTVKTTSNGITTSADSSITVNASVVAAPVISVTNRTDLASSATVGNQWYLNGVVIQGANDQTYIVSENGTYTVTSTVNGCSSLASSPYVYLTTGVINLGNDQYIRLYPNPIKSDLFMNWKINGAPLLNVQVVDLHGRILISQRNVLQGRRIDVSGLRSGVYFIKVFDSSHKISRTVKVIK